jgi:AcrR family transcriptional regulator
MDAKRLDHGAKSHTLVSYRRMTSARHSAIVQDSQFATRVALLDAAERLFSQNGIEGTSVREIIKAAGANLGAINYHFGTKDRLALEVFARRIEPVNRERIARLDALEAGAGRRKLKLEQILDVLIRPVMESEEQGAKNCDDFMRLLSRSFQEQNAEVKKFVEQQFAEVARRFDAAILRAVPGLRPADLFWRMCFLHGALHHGLQTWLRFDQIPYAVLNPAARKPNRDGLIQRLIAFMAAGMSAPSPKSR